MWQILSVPHKEIHLDLIASPKKEEQVSADLNKLFEWKQTKELIYIPAENSPAKANHCNVNA